MGAAPTPGLIKSVLICGCATGLVPESYADNFDSIWTLNLAHHDCGVTPDLVIAMDDLRRDAKAEPGYVERLFDGHKADVLTTVANKKWPRAKPYPLQDVVDKLAIRRIFAARLFDNSLNYAFMLAIVRGFKIVGFHGCAFSRLDRPGDPEAFAADQWNDGPYRKRPDWFKWHAKDTLLTRRPREPGIEAFHFLLGVAVARGYDVQFSSPTTIMNFDREPYFYGFEKQPRIKFNDDA